MENFASAITFRRLRSSASKLFDSLFVSVHKIAGSNVFEKETDDFAVVLSKDFSVAEVGEGEDGQSYGVEDAFSLWQPNGVLSTDRHVISDLHRFIECIERDFRLSSEWLEVQSHSS